MQFTLEKIKNCKLLTNYGKGFIEVEGKRYHTGICLFGNKVIDGWTCTNPLALSIKELEPILSNNPKILILGTGLKLIFPAINLIKELQLQGTVIETMSTSAACRTYNILANDHRQVAAALMQIKP